jgi:hypothetical protein
MDTIKHTAIFVRNFFANYNNLKLIGLCGLFLVSIGSSKITAQQQAHNLSDNLSEQSPSEKMLQALYEISTLTASTELPAHYQAAFQKLNTDFPLKQALGAAFDKGAIYAWLQKEPSSIESVYELFSAYLSELKPAKPATETDEGQKAKQKAPYRSQMK